MRQSNEKTANEGQNPYIDSLEELGSPSPMLEKYNRHKHTDPEQNNFGLLTKNDERFVREHKHHLMHRTETERAIEHIKAYMRNEDPMGS